MDLGLQGKRALVTGSSAGIGAGIARMLADEGCAVIVQGRDEARTRKVAADIGAVALAVADLSSDAGADTVAAVAGDVDILVNCAGGATASDTLTWGEVSETIWAETYQQNTVSAVRLIRRLLPAMKARGWGRIINISSSVAIKPAEIAPDYGAAKAAVLNMTVSLAKHLGACGVTANSISPGLIVTPSLMNWAETVKEAKGWGDISVEEMERRLAVEIVKIPVGRVGRAEDIGLAVCMLASPASGYISGANIRVDGGFIEALSV